MEKNNFFPADINGVNTGQATFQFKGHLYRKPVIWQCTLQTLDHHYQSLVASKKVSAAENIVLKKFIYISEEQSAAPKIHIGLDVDKIDEATIRKTIIMVNNYKKLHAGLHEYGMAYHYPKKQPEM